MREMQKPVVRWWWFSVAAAVAVAFLATGVLRVGAQAPANGTGGPKEGITVHGHWTIDVRQPDGTLVTHHEFENALQPGGASTIADLLAHRIVASHWKIVLGSPSGAGPCYLLPSTPVVPVGCVIAQPGWASTDGYLPDPTSQLIFENLVVDPNGLKLSGTVTARRAGEFNSVGAELYTCPSPDARVNIANDQNAIVPASACATPPPIGFGSFPFAGFFSFTPVSVQNLVPNQLIQVSVTYTFSAGETHINP